MPIGKRVWESPPVPTVSGSRRRFSQEWMTPSPGRSDTPPRAAFTLRGLVHVLAACSVLWLAAMVWFLAVWLRGRVEDPRRPGIALAGLVVLALTFVGLPFVVRTLQPVLESLDRDVEEAAAVLGAGRWTTFRRVIAPTLLPPLLTGFALSFARAIGE